MNLLEFARDHDIAKNEITRRLCGPKQGPLADRCASNREYAVRMAKRHLYYDFAVVGFQECYPESISLVENVLPWVEVEGGLQVLRVNGHEQRVGMPRVQSMFDATGPEVVSAILASNDWDVEMFEFGFSLFRAAIDHPRKKNPPSNHTSTRCDNARSSRLVNYEKLRKGWESRDEKRYYERMNELKERLGDAFAVGNWTSMSKSERKNWKKAWTSGEVTEEAHRSAGALVSIVGQRVGDAASSGDERGPQLLPHTKLPSDLTALLVAAGAENFAVALFENHITSVSAIQNASDEKLGVTGMPDRTIRAVREVYRQIHSRDIWSQ